MTSTHAHIPNLKELKNQLDTLGVEEFHKHYSVYESFIGPDDAMEFLEEEIRKYEIYK